MRKRRARGQGLKKGAREGSRRGERPIPADGTGKKGMKVSNEGEKNRKLHKFRFREGPPEVVITIMGSNIKNRDKTIFKRG